MWSVIMIYEMSETEMKSRWHVTDVLRPWASGGWWASPPDPDLVSREACSPVHPRMPSWAGGTPRGTWAPATPSSWAAPPAPQASAGLWAEWLWSGLWVRRQLALRKCSLRSCGLWGPNTRRSYSPKHFLTFLTTFAAGSFPLPFSTKLYFWKPSQYHTVLKMSFPVDFGCGFMSVGETWLSGGQMLKSTWSTLTENY